MTQRWFMENNFSIVNNSETMMVEIYHDDVLIHSEDIILSGSSPRIKADTSIRNFYEYFYPVCISYRRNLLILDIMNDSDIGYQSE